MKETKIEDKKIYAAVPLGRMLIDLRSNTYGIKFGTVEGMCKQFGVNVTVLKNGVLEFSAPKLRMQMLIEKLHFSRTRYWA